MSEWWWWVSDSTAAQRPRPLDVHLRLGAQVDDVGHPELLDEALDVGLGEVLQVVGADQPPGCRVPAVAGRQPAEVAHVHEAVELDPPVRHRVIVGRARRGEWRGAPTARRRPRAGVR